MKQWEDEEHARIEAAHGSRDDKEQESFEPAATVAAGYNLADVRGSGKKTPRRSGARGNGRD
jgi:hypothetical protein